MAFSSIKRETLEECISKALPNQTEMEIQNLATALRDLGAEFADDIQYAEANDLATVLKPIQIRKLLQHVKENNQRIGIGSSKQIQSSHSAFQQQRFQYQLPSNLSGVCIQIPATNFSSSFEMPKISSDKLYDSKMIYSNQTPLNKVMCPTSKQFPFNFNFHRSQINSQYSNIPNYRPAKFNQGSSNTSFRSEFSNQHRPTRPFLTDIHIERDKSAGIGKAEIVDLSPNKITNDSSMWDISENKRTSAPIVVSDDSNSSIVCESLISQECENSDELPVNDSSVNDSSVNDSSVNDSSKTIPQTPETSTLHSLENNTIHEDNFNWLEKFRIPWNKMPPALIDKLDKHERPEQDLRWAMIRVVIAEIIKLCAKPTQRNLQQVAHRMVMNYPESLCDPNSRNQRGCRSICKLLQTRLEIVSQPDRGQFNFQKKQLSYARTRNSGKFLSNYGFINWQPVRPPHNETTRSLKMKQEILKTISMTPNWDLEEVKANMISTYFQQRKDINTGTPIGTLCKEWPFLFEEIGIMVHFKELTGVDLKEVIQEIIDNKIKKVIDFMKTVKLAMVQAEVDSILEEISKEDLTPGNQKKKEIAAIVPLIMLFMNEDRHILFPQADHPAMAVMTPEIPFLLVCGNSILESTQFSLCIEKEIVNDKISNFFTGVIMLFASYYCFNIHYPDEASGTLEFMQRCLVGINPPNKSISKQFSIHPKVVTLLAALTKFDWPVPPELDDYLPLRESGLLTPPPLSSNIGFMSYFSDPNYLPTDEGNNEQLLSENSPVFDSERLSVPNANNLSDEETQELSSSELASYIAYKMPAQPNDEQQSLNSNLQPNETESNAIGQQAKDLPQSAASKKKSKSRKKTKRGKNTAASRAHASNSTSKDNSHAESSGNHRTKNWTKEYWRLKVRDSRNKSKSKKNKKKTSNMDADLAVESNMMMNSQAPATDSFSFLLDTYNVPAANGQPIQNALQDTAAPPQEEPSSEILAAQKLASFSSNVFSVPVYRFELREYSHWMTARFCYMWKMRLLCNAAIGNGTSNIMVHRDVLLATCIKLLEESNSEIFQGNFLQLTFTSNVKDEALWSLCYFLYEGYLILNANILDNMDNIGYLLGIPNLQHLVEQYKKGSLTGLSSEPGKVHTLTINQEILKAYTEKYESAFKPDVQTENTQKSGNLMKLTYTHWSLNTGITLSTVMTGGTCTPPPDYTNNTMVIVVEAEPNNLPSKISDFMTPELKKQ